MDISEDLLFALLSKFGEIEKTIKNDWLFIAA
jgi:hypothetical protein